MNDGIILRGILLIVYTFIIITIYIVASSPFENVISGIEDVNMTATDSYVETAGTNIRLAFNMSFALAILVPTLWFIVWIFRSEPDWGYR